jgi:heme/copper-type cytochrome/quinol oxidase subunit 1
MKNIKPYFFCVFATIVLIALYFIVNPEATFVFNIHDTYYVIAIKHIVLFLFYLFGIISIIYIVFDFLKINLSKINIWIHVIGSFISLLFLFYLNYLSNELPAKENGFEDFINTPDYNLYFFVLILIIISLQFFFLINIFVAIIKKLRLYYIS